MVIQATSCPAHPLWGPLMAFSSYPLFRVCLLETTLFLACVCVLRQPSPLVNVCLLEVSWALNKSRASHIMHFLANLCLVEVHCTSWPTCVS